MPDRVEDGDHVVGRDRVHWLAADYREHMSFQRLDPLRPVLFAFRPALKLGDVVIGRFAKGWCRGHYDDGFAGGSSLVDRVVAESAVFGSLGGEFAGQGEAGGGSGDGACIAWPESHLALALAALTGCADDRLGDGIPIDP
jgi:hypothetical protein